MMIPSPARKNSMRYNRNSVVFLIAALLLCAPRAFPDPATAPTGPHIVMIIRHAEKPDETDGEKDPNLSKAGFARADALAQVIPDHFPHPDFLIATKRSKGSNRPIETITPLSKALHEDIETTFKDEEYTQVAHSVLTDPKYAGKTVLIAWHHGKIPELAKALGVSNGPDKWNSNVFDRVWEISYEDGKATMKDLPQKAMPGDEQE
jgi:phosphohistidine phosphatase SixA